MFRRSRLSIGLESRCPSSMSPMMINHYLVDLSDQRPSLV
jgi:hypothetical protein